MCGIVGYVGNKESTPLLLEGLRRLEYRGYDSAGVAVMNGGGVEMRRAAGKIARARSGHRGGADARHGRHRAHALGHARSADGAQRASAHGRGRRRSPWCTTASSRTSTSLKKSLEARGHVFASDTDTEVLVAPDRGAVRRQPRGRGASQALKQVEGTYGIAVISSRDRDKIVAARKGSPLLIGVGEDECFVATDVSAILAHTREVVYLEDGDVAVLTRGGYPRDRPFAERRRRRPITQIDWDLDADRARRLRALHAQGDLRAAEDGREHDARPHCCRKRARPSWAA